MTFVSFRNHRFPKGILFALRLAVFLLLFVLFTVPSLAADGPSVAIVTDKPSVGDPIETTVTGTDTDLISYSWLSGGEELSEKGSSYVPGPSDYESWIEVRILDTEGNLLDSDKIYFSSLPVVYIDTEDARTIDSRDEYIGATLRIQPNDTYDTSYYGEIEIRGRGTSSWSYPKQGYKLKLSKKADLFGFGKGKHYVLLPNYLDSSLLRNMVAYRLASTMGLLSTDATWVDVVLNGEYYGNYQFVESIRIGKQFLDISDWDDYGSLAAEAIYEANPDAFPEGYDLLETQLCEDLQWMTTDEVTFAGITYRVSDYYELPEDLISGFIFELDSEENKEKTCFTTDAGIVVNVASPEYLYTNETLYAETREFFQDIEDAFRSSDGYNSKGQHYTELVDMDSMVSYWLVMELLSNEDSGSRSRYCYRGEDGKLTFGPVWDFDISSGSYRSFMDPYYWSVTSQVAGLVTGQEFWKEVVDDPYFQVLAQEKYWEIRPVLEELVEDGGIIDQYAEYLYESGVANETLWVTGEDFMGRNFSGSAGDVEIYRGFLRERIEWMDSAFDTETSTAASLYFLTSENPYSRSAMELVLLVGGERNFTDHGADYLVDAGRNIRIRHRTLLGTTKVYVNGILAGTYSAKKVYSGITLSSDVLTREPGKKNVITLVTTYRSKTYRNHISVVVKGGEAEELTFQAGCEVKTDCGSHNLVHVEAREATESRYGLAECWYCTDCHLYFEDAEGLSPVSAKDVILPSNPDIFSGDYVQKILHLIVKNLPDI